jgi:hypothetical protein
MNMKHFTTLTWMLAIAIAGVTITACSSNDNETEKPFTTDPVENTLYACGVGQPETRSVADAQNMLFTEDDIEWFNVTTRELHFRDTMESLREKIPFLAGIDFYLGGEYLFSGGATFVGLICSQVFNDLVLCCGKIEDGEVIDNNRYYLYDCYPNTPQFLNDEQVQDNIKKRAPQWDTFTNYLESKGKLRK